MAFDLASLLKDVPASGTGREQIEYIRLEKLIPDENNFYQLNGLEELAANIQLCGLQQPIRVRKCSEKPDGYTIVSGHRRRAAIELLAADEPERWAETPCIVEQDEASPALQQLRLIYANSNTRVLLPSEVSKQAVEVEKLLYQLKEEGYEFPGRMRDHVAKAVGASKSKLSRLKVIRDDLAECWRDAWEKGDLAEATAYSLAQMPSFWQSILFDQYGAAPKQLYDSAVNEYRKRFEKIDKIECECSANAFTCVNKVSMMQHSCKDRWAEPCASGCCMKCSNLKSCRHSCSAADSKKKQLREDAKADKKAEEQYRQQKEAPIIDFVRQTYERVGLARAASGKTLEQVFAMQKKFPSTKAFEEFEALERGHGKPSVNTDMPFGYCVSASTLMTIAAVADGLGCSIDYLLGRTEEMRPVPEAGTIWHPISEEPPVGVNLVWVDYDGHADTGRYEGGQRISIVSTISWDEARWWAYLPEA